MRASFPFAAAIAITSCLAALHASAEMWEGVRGAADDGFWFDADSVRRDEANNLLVVRTNRPDDPKNPGTQIRMGCFGDRLSLIAGKTYWLSASNAAGSRKN